MNQSEQPPLIIYHGHCDDGFCAAHVAHSFLTAIGKEPELYAGVYQEDPPDVRGRDVVIVDFSYKRGVMDTICDEARSVLILDHHKTAIADLSGIATNPTREWFDHIADGGVTVMFDMERSGATLAFDYFYRMSRRLGEPSGDRPAFINYVEDRDLWRKSLPNGDEFTIALRSYPQTIEQWDALVLNGGSQRDVDALVLQGIHIQRYYRQQVEAMKANAYRAVFRYFGPTRTEADPLASQEMRAEITIANAPYAFASEVAGELAVETGVGACFFQLANGRWQYSLRSRDGIDVTPIALAFGGGGHAAAAGFTADQPVHTMLDQVDLGPEE